ncbi:MAG: NAD(P)/FAD-dependent oxidoreductase [Candidatus Methylomirabilales bacterium]
MTNPDTQTASMTAPETTTLLAAGRVLARPSTSLAPRIMILGGGFAGVYTALELAKRCAGVLPVQTTLVSEQNFLLFTPMLAEAATGAVETRHVLYPIRPLCGAWGVEFGEMSVETIDLDRRRVMVRHRRSPVRQRVHYDKLVLALGATPNTDIAPGASEHALAFKEAGDAMRIRNRVINLFESAALTDDPWTRRRLLTFVVVGAGHAGTELMAALEELTREILLRHYPSIPSDDVRLILVGGKVLPQTATNLAAYAKEQLLSRGIELETTRAAAVTPEGLTLKDGRTIPSQCVIWTAGNRVSPVVANLPLPKGRDDRLKVNEFFEVEGVRDVYALGDNAAQIDPHTGDPYVATAQVAIRQARALAKVLEAELTGRPKKPFRFKVLGEMVPLSRRTAVADLKGIKLVGFVAWFFWKTVYMLKLPTLAARVRVVLDWTVELFFERDVSELTVEEERGG